MVRGIPLKLKFDLDATILYEIDDGDGVPKVVFDMDALVANVTNQVATAAAAAMKSELEKLDGAILFKGGVQ